MVRFQLTLAYDDVVQRKHSSSYTLLVMFVAETAILKTDGFQAADRGSIPRIVLWAYTGNWQPAYVSCIVMQRKKTQQKNSLLVQIQSGPFCDTVTAKTKTFWSHKPIVKAGVM